MSSFSDPVTMSRSSSSSGMSYLVDMGSVRLNHESRPRTLRDTVRPQESGDVMKAWHGHFASPTTMEELRHRAINKGGLSLDYSPHSADRRRVDELGEIQNGKGKRTRGAAGEDEQGPLMRSVYWRIYLSTVPYPFPPAAVLGTALASTRARYDQLRRKHLIAPDGRWAGDCTVPDGEAQSPSVDSGTSRRSGASSGFSSGGAKTAAWDPLDLEEHNPWQSWFQHEELRKTILKDIERTFPDVPYFIDPAVRKIMMTILFLWSVENDEVGYRQGMHELLGVLLMVCDRDAYVPERESTVGADSPHDPLNPSPGSTPESHAAENSVALMILDADKVEHDVWTLFEKVMDQCRGWYEWRSKAGQSKSSIAKIVGICNHLQGDALRSVDPILHDKLESEAIEGQLWGIRYIRLLFTREMPLLSAMRLWDGLFAEDPGLEDMVEAICLALLLRIRSLLISGDYSTILTHLLRYPPNTPEIPLVPDMLLHQALLLRRDRSLASGATIALQNQEVLGITPVALLNDEPVHVSAHRNGRGYARASGQASPLTAAPKAAGTRFDSLARGLMERAQASGLDKTLYSAVTEIRKNLPEFPASPATAFPFRTFSPPSEDTGYSHIPSMTQAMPQPPPRTLRDADLEVAELRLSLINMGKSMDKWLLAIKADTDVAEPGETNRSEISQQKDLVAEGWAGMYKLRDALLNAAITPATDMAREWAWSLGEAEPTKAEALMQLAYHQPQAGLILGQTRSGHVRNLSNGAPIIPPQPRTDGSQVTPRPTAPPNHTPLPLESRLAGLVQGTSPRQFAFPSPFSGTSTAGKPEWGKQRAQAVPIPPPIRQARPPMTSAGTEILFDRPETPDSAQTTTTESYPPVRSLAEEEPVDLDPLSGARPISSVSRLKGVHGARKAVNDPLSAAGLQAGARGG